MGKIPARSVSSTFHNLWFFFLAKIAKSPGDEIGAAMFCARRNRKDNELFHLFNGQIRNQFSNLKKKFNDLMKTYFHRHVPTLERTPK